MHSTTANDCNPLRRRQLRALHIQDELHGSKPDPFIRSADSLEPFLELRRQRINQLLDMAGREVEKEVPDKLAQLTRGLHYRHVNEAVQEWLSTGNWPKQILHPTNTCDPGTGSWSERLMDPAQLQKVLMNMGFSEVHLEPGKWHPSAHLLKRLAGSALNIMQKKMPPFLYWKVAPSFMLCVRVPG